MLSELGTAKGVSFLGQEVRELHKVIQVPLGPEVPPLASKSNGMCPARVGGSPTVENHCCGEYIYAQE